MNNTLRTLVLWILLALTTSACASVPGYPTYPAYYFNDRAQLALAEAGARGDVAGMRSALQSGADPNAVGVDGMTPLFWVTTMTPNLEGLKFMLANGGDPNLHTRQDDGDDAYLIKQAFVNPDLAFLRAVLEAGADPNARVSGSDTLLFPSGIDEKIRERVRLLIEHGADINARGYSESTPLLSHVESQDWLTARALLEAGADPALKNEFDDTALGFIRALHENYLRLNGAPLGGESGGYLEFLDALKERGYLEESFGE